MVLCLALVGCFTVILGKSLNYVLAVSSVATAQIMSCAFKSIWRFPDDKLCYRGRQNATLDYYYYYRKKRTELGLFRSL